MDFTSPEMHWRNKGVWQAVQNLVSLLGAHNRGAQTGTAIISAVSQAKCASFRCVKGAVDLVGVGGNSLHENSF